MNPSQDVQPQTKEEIATLGGGCFWCLEAVFDDVKGVKDVVSGYSGGEIPNPSYREVCNGTTGHAEVVQVKFDPSEISYAELLNIYFSVHDPTTLNRQGADIGTQYRSVVFYHTLEQKKLAEQVIEDIEKHQVWEKPLVTDLTAFKEFFPAEDYHQEYYSNNTRQPYCQIVIAPKVSKFRRQYADRLKA